MLARLKKEAEVVFWLQSKDKDTGRVTYMFQIEGRPRQINKVAKKLNGSVAGEGFNPQNKTNILIIKKSFLSIKEFKQFKKQLDFALKENKN